MATFRCSFSSALPDNLISVTTTTTSRPHSSELSLNQIHLFPSFKFPKILSMAETRATGQQKITLENRHNERLVGILHETRSTDVVVLCHGFRSSKDNKMMVNISTALENKGISSFRFDFAGNGESEGSFQFGNYWREVEDTRSVVEYFNGADRRIAAILGHSKGGNVVLLYASKYHDIPTVVNVSGRYKLDRGIAERFGSDFLEKIKREGYVEVKDGGNQYRITEESLMERLNTNMHEASLQIDKECRVLTVHGSADEIIPVEDAYEFAKIIPNHSLQIIEGANHGYDSHQAELISVVVPFIEGGLQQTKTLLTRDSGPAASSS